MSGFGLGNVLYDVTKGSVFGARNLDKTANGDAVRAFVCAGQAKNVLSSVADDFKEAEKIIKAYGDPYGNWKCLKDMKPKDLAKIKIPRLDGKGFLSLKTIRRRLEELDWAYKCKGNKLANAGNNISKAVQAVGKGDSAFKYVVKVSDFASKIVNPLICVSGGVKVVMADDKTSEGIKQTAALGTMFAGEALARNILTAKGRTAFAKKALGQNAVAKKLMHWGWVLDSYKMRNHFKGAKVILPVAKALAFVGTSIASYSIGSKIGDAINDLRKPNSPKPVVKVPNKKVNLSA